MNAPKNGDLYYSCGYEFIVNNVTIHNVTQRGETFKVCRFTGVCTDHPRNDSIRNTGYNGGTYGYRISEHTPVGVCERQ